MTKTLKEEVLSHFNEPMVDGFNNLVRCIGYGESECDNCVITMNARGKIKWHTSVGGFVFLDGLKGQNYVRLDNDEGWDDFVRLDSSLHWAGAPKQEKPIIQEWYRLFLDDVRDPPYIIYKETDYRECDWHVARSFQEFKDAIAARGMPQIISFDHDLGSDGHGNVYPTGYDAAKWLVDQSIDGHLDIAKTQFLCHSANPVGRANIMGLLDSYLKSISENNTK